MALKTRKYGTLLQICVHLLLYELKCQKNALVYMKEVWNTIKFIPD